MPKRHRVDLPEALRVRFVAIQDEYRKRGLVVPPIQQLCNQATEAGLAALETVVTGETSK
jgi:N-acetylglutamate synthase-like GNAT family acetyltransferase